MPRLTWDQVGQKKYETGAKKAILFPQSEAGIYPEGFAWNGLTGVSENPSGAEATAIYADDAKYLSLTSAEDFAATVTAYTYPDEFEECDGSAEITEGVTIGQQDRKQFGLSYETIVGNDTKKNSYGRKIHFVYGATASPSSKDRKTVNDSPEAIEFSWELNTTPVTVEGFKPTAHLVVNTTKLEPACVTALENVIYGTESETSRMPLPDEIKTIIDGAKTQG